MSTPVDKVPAFRRVVKSAIGGEVLIPIIQSYLWNPKFPAITIRLPGFSVRPPDYWFHPSTHPLWPERLLYWYMKDPARLITEPFDPNSTMAVTAGSFWHDFHQQNLIAVGALRAREEPCGCGNRQCKEWYFEDPARRSRGHVDGLVIGNIVGLAEDEIFEYKTMHEAKMAKIAKGSPTDPEVLESFKRRCPEYYAQGQEYLRISGMRRWRAVIQQISYPFSMREIAMEFDPHFAASIRQKYERVLAALEAERAPMDCCALKDCPARTLCMGGV